MFDILINYLSIYLLIQYGRRIGKKVYFLQITVISFFHPGLKLLLLFTGMMERSIRRYDATSHFPISLENSSWLESMGSLVNKGEESRILLGRELSFGSNYQVV